MDTSVRSSRTIVVLVAILASSTVFAHATEGIIASKSLTVQAAGPRQGSGGSNYFNVQGKNKEKYAGFGLLVFPLPKAGPARTLSSPGKLGTCAFDSLFVYHSLCCGIHVGARRTTDGGQ